MANQCPPDRIFCSRGAMRISFFLLLIVINLVIYCVNPPLYRRSNQNSKLQSPCPPCSCDCFYEDSLFGSSETLKNFTVCEDHDEKDQEIIEEIAKNLKTLIIEELDLMKMVVNETVQTNGKSAKEVKKILSHFQNEAEKCKRGIMACEAARERSQSEFAEEIKLSAMWERRARLWDWTESSGWRRHNQSNVTGKPEKCTVG